MLIFLNFDFYSSDTLHRNSIRPYMVYIVVSCNLKLFFDFWKICQNYVNFLIFDLLDVLDMNYVLSQVSSVHKS